MPIVAPLGARTGVSDGIMRPDQSPAVLAAFPT
jgi:hypothetical protein